jgi:hypothetical protein
MGSGINWHGGLVIMQIPFRDVKELRVHDGIDERCTEVELKNGHVLYVDFDYTLLLQTESSTEGLVLNIEYRSEERLAIFQM